MRALPLTIAMAMLASATSLSAQSPAPRRGSMALEADILAYGINGTSGILSMSFANGLQVAAGIGSYDVPEFLLEGDPNYDAAHWKARSTLVRVARVTYRLRGAMQNGLALGAVVLDQRWRLTSENVSGETKFSPVSIGITAGYYLHIGKHFYLYPTTAFTYNSVAAGSTQLGGLSYKVNRFGPNASLHIGWEVAR